MILSVDAEKIGCGQEHSLLALKPGTYKNKPDVSI